MKQTRPYLALIRDIILSLSIAALLPLITHRIAEIIDKYPNFEKFPCQYEGVSCQALSEERLKLTEKLAELQALEKPSMHEQQEAAKKEQSDLNREIKAVQEKIDKAMTQKYKAFHQAQVKPAKTRLYLAIVIGLAALLAGLFTPVLSLEIGAILGGILTLFMGFIFSWFILSDVLKLVALLLALLCIIAISLKIYHKNK